LIIVRTEHVDSNCPGVRQIITLIHSIIQIRYEFITIERRMGTLKQGESDEFMDSIIDDLRTKSKEAGLKELDKMWESIDAEEVSEESSTTISNSTVTPTVEETIKKSIVEIKEHTKPKFIAKPF